MDWIVDQWARMGHFYSSLESGHATASTAMKRLNGFTGKNHFYRANREAGYLRPTTFFNNGIDLQLIEHISSIAWDNVILYGEYVNRPTSSNVTVPGCCADTL